MVLHEIHEGPSVSATPIYIHPIALRYAAYSPSHPRIDFYKLGCRYAAHTTPAEHIANPRQRHVKWFIC
jgi:hypothetical protein